MTSLENSFGEYTRNTWVCSCRDELGTKCAILVYSRPKYIGDYITQAKLVEKNGITTPHASKLARYCTQQEDRAQDLAGANLTGAHAHEGTHTQDLVGACTRVQVQDQSGARGTRDNDTSVSYCKNCTK